MNEASDKAWFEHELGFFRASDAERELYGGGDYAEADSIADAAQRLAADFGYHVGAEYLARRNPNWED